MRSARCRPGPEPPVARDRRGTGAAPRPSRSAVASSPGRALSTSHDQVLRNQAVGSTCRMSGSGPAFVTWTDISTSPRIGLGVVHLDDPVPVAVEGSGVQQLVLRIEFAAAPVLLAQILVRKGSLRIVVAPPVPGVAGHGVEVPPVLLDVLAVVGLGAGQPEDALLEDRVAPVPQAPGPGTAAARCQRTRRDRPPPTGTPWTARDRAGDTPMPPRRCCSPRARCPTAAR